MTITVAMALSGLEPEQWNDGLKDIYMQGSILFPKSPSTLSIASSSASSYYSLESGISSMSPDSAAYLNLNHFINDIDNLGLDGFVHIQANNDQASRGSKAVSLTDVVQELEAVLEQTIKQPPIGTPKMKKDEEEMQANKVYTQVSHQGRDLLNLFANINGGWKYQTSVLPEGVHGFYFDNRSQYSRLQDAYPPKHTKAPCKEKDCAFVETIYF